MTQHRFLLLVFYLYLMTGGGISGEAQDLAIDIRHWELEDGLTHRNVQGITKDDRGFIWVATQGGLNRFDGTDFQLFDKRDYGFQSDEINHIVKDQDGLLWLFNLTVYLNREPRTIDIFNPYTEESQTFGEAFAPSPPFLVSQVAAFTNKSDGELIFFLNDGRLFFYRFGEWKSVQTNVEGPKPPNYMYCTDKKEIWIINEYKINNITRTKIYGITESGETLFEKIILGARHFNITRSDEDGTVHFVSTDESNRNRFFHIDGYEWKNGDPQLEDIAKNMEHDFFIGLYNVYIWDKDKAYFLDTDLEKNALWVIDLKNENNAVKIDQYDFKEATHLFIDEKNSLWISSQFGFYQVNLRENNFNTFLSAQDQGLKAFRGLIVDYENRLWAAEENRALWRSDSIKSSWKKYPLTHHRPNILDPGYAFSLSSKGDSSIYVSQGQFLYEIDLTQNKIRMIALPSPRKTQGVDLNFDEIWVTHEANDGLLWYGTDRGDIGFIGKDTSGWLEQNNKPINQYNIYDFHEDDGFLWVASDQGMIKVNMSEKVEVARYWSNGIKDYYFPIDIVYHIYRDIDGSFWLGTGGSGLVHWVPEMDTISETTKVKYIQYDRRDGLSSNEIYAVYPDGMDNLWLSSNYGIIKFNKINHTSIVFLEKDGISNNEFNRISHTMSLDSTIYFGGLNGVTGFQPKVFQQNISGINDPLVITDFRQFIKDRDALTDLTLELIQSDSIVMASDDPFFRLAFSLLSYEEPGKVNYAYIIDGLDNDWNYIDQNFIRVNRLPFGKYKLRIKGQNAKGYWSEDVISLSLIVRKPYYLSWSFIVLMLSVATAVVLCIIRYRTRILELKKKELEEAVENRTIQIKEDKKIIEDQAEELLALDKVKSTFFANVSHELRTPLTLILGPLNSILKGTDLLPNDRSMLLTAKRNAQELLKLVSSLLDLSKIENKKLDQNKQAISLQNFVRPISNEFEVLANTTDKEFKCHYLIEEDIHVSVDAEKLRTCIKNLLSNAFKYTGPKSRIELRVADSATKLRIDVIDNGRGIHPSDLPFIFDRYFQSRRADMPAEGGTGIGLALTKELVELMGGKIKVESELDMGSRFTIYLTKEEVIDRDTLDTLEEKEEVNVIKPLSMDDTQKPVILIVEDHADLRNYLCHILKEQYLVIEAANGEEGLNALQIHGDVDLIITDLMMPVMDGFEFIEIVKGDAKYLGCPVIVLSAKGESVDKVRALRFGVDDYLTKPFDEDELLVRMQNLLTRLKRRQSVQEEVIVTLEDDAEEASIKELKVPNESDLQWLEEVENFVLKYMDDGQFSNNFLSAHFDISRRQLQRKLKAIVGLTPKEYINEVRMNKAKEILESGLGESVKMVAHSVGFSTPTYFSKLFTDRFGKAPNQYMK